MVASQYIYKLKFTEVDSEGKVIFENKYKSNDELIGDIGFKYAIFNRSTIYRIINRFLKVSHQNIRIDKIREIIPHKIIKTVILL